MKKVLPVFILLLSVVAAQATKHTITNVGFTFSPDNLTIVAGDTVVFSIAAAHSVREVSEATWDADGNTSNGGFSLPSGGGMITLPNPGTYFYVCIPHASMGMKGKIIVTQASGVEDLVSGNLSFSVYPNPITDYLSIRTNTPLQYPATIRVFNVQGTLLREEQFADKTAIENKINLSLLPDGNYLLQVQSGDKQKTISFEKRH